MGNKQWAIRNGKMGKSLQQFKHLSTLTINQWAEMNYK